MGSRPHFVQLAGSPLQAWDGVTLVTMGDVVELCSYSSDEPDLAFSATGEVIEGAGGRLFEVWEPILGYDCQSTLDDPSNFTFLGDLTILGGPNGPSRIVRSGWVSPN